ncbi:MAG: hypothetical protein KF752_08090 [Pirellulaceae bacterium]|nr:hypothetical protein [Pirellulaceae bacterium]
MNFVTRFIQDGRVRQGYILESKKSAKLILDEVQSGKLTPLEGADEANKIRNSIMDAARIRSSDIGRAQAEAFKGSGLTLQALEEKYAQRLFNQTFDKLSSAQKNQVWLTIIESSGRANPAMNAKAAKVANAGKALVFVSAGIAVYNIATAEEKGRQVVKEGATAGAGILGSMGGALAELACAPDAPACVAVGVFVGGAAAAKVGAEPTGY